MMIMQADTPEGGDLISGIERGKIYIYLGKETILAYPIPEYTLVPSENHELFGSTISNAGDFNGDGFNDIIIGSPARFEPESKPRNDDTKKQLFTGAAYLFLGASEFDTIPDLIFSTSIEKEGFANSVGVGDYNGDGFDDVIIGILGRGKYDNTEIKGGFNVYYGGEEIDNQEDSTRRGKHGIGRDIESIGDFNGDGYDDFIFLYPYYDNGYFREVFLVLGNTYEEILITKDFCCNNYATDIESIGDFNGDGFADFLVNAPYTSGFTRTQVGLYFGNDSLDVSSDIVFEGRSLSGGGFGSDIGGGGDINNDGYSDLIISEDSRFGDMNNSKAYVYLVKH